VTEVFVDTSALFALLVSKDRFHFQARRQAAAFQREALRWVTSSAVVVETVSLLQARVGLEEVRAFRAGIEPMLTIEWIGPEILQAALSSLLAANQRSVSLTDWTSFEIARKRGIRRIFTFDADFAQQGFELVPSGI
jgi:uncharacterized protein